VSVNIDFYFLPSKVAHRLLSNPPVDKIHFGKLSLLEAWEDSDEVRFDMPEPAAAEWQYHAVIYSDLLFACATLADSASLVFRSARSAVYFLAPFIVSGVAPQIWDDRQALPYPIAGQLLSPATIRRLRASFDAIDWNSLKELESAVRAASMKLPCANPHEPLELVTSVELLHRYLSDYERLCRRAQELDSYIYLISG
jgi:hypothetical protein